MILRFPSVMAFFRKAEVDPDERGKVFTWTRDKRLWMHLTAFLIFSILIHGSGFYLFKVVYPSPVRVEAEPESITVMDASDPATRSVLQRLSDRTVFLAAPSAESDVRVRLEEQQVHFTPAFQNTDLEPIPPETLRKGTGLPDPLPSGYQSPLEAAGVDTGPVRRDAQLAQRAYAPWSLFHDYLALAETLPKVRMRIEVAPGGEVRVVEQGSELGEIEKRELAEVVESTLRFVPAAEPISGWIEVGGG